MKDLIVASILFILIDSLYLSSMTKYFTKQISDIQKSALILDMQATILCYMFLILGLYYFILKDKKSVFDAFVFGLVLYMVFETTNKALFTKWNWLTVLYDGVWGGILYASTTYLTYQLTK